jgi:DNA replication protein DnaC
VQLRVPTRFRNARMEQLDKKQFGPVFKYVKMISDHAMAGRGLLLSGPPGVGKSHAIAALTRATAEYWQEQQRFFDYEFITAADLFDRYPLWVNGDAGEDALDKRRNQLWRKTATAVPWLVINDLSKEYRGGQVKEQVTYKLGRILRERHEQKLVTHVTTNAAPKEIRIEYGESIASLLSEMCQVFIVNGPDRRKEKVE